MDSGATSLPLTPIANSFVVRVRTASAAGSVGLVVTVVPRAARVAGAPAISALPTIRTGPAHAAAFSAAVKTTTPALLPAGIVAPVQLTPGGSPSADTWISPLNPSRRSATTRTGTAPPLRSNGGAGSSAGSARTGAASSAKSGFSFRTDSTYASRGSSRVVPNRSRTSRRYVESSFTSSRYDGSRLAVLTSGPPG